MSKIYSVLSWGNGLVLFEWQAIGSVDNCETSAKTVSGRLRRGHPGETKMIAQKTKSVDIVSEYLLRTNGQLFEMNVKIVSSYLQAGKAFDPLQHD